MLVNDKEEIVRRRAKEAIEELQKRNSQRMP
jgi:hypothetical protein